MKKQDTATKISKQVSAKLQEIAEAIADGSATADEFQMPFGGTGGAPHNVDSQHYATGSNALICWIMGITHYSTYDGWLRAGYAVPAGQQSIVSLRKPMPIKYERENKQTGETEEHSFTKFSAFAIWDFSQVVLRTPESDAALQEKWDKRSKQAGRERKIVPPMPENPWTPPVVERRTDVELQKAVQDYIANTGADVEWVDADRACYTPSVNKITLPLPERFRDTKHSTAAQNLASTALHELGHWTGGAQQLGRNFSMERRQYAAEELLAESLSAILCAQLGVESTMRMDHAQYIASWLKALNNDPKFIFDTGSAAQKAVDYLNSLQPAALTEAA